MSTDYIPDPDFYNVPFDELKNLTIKEHGVAIFDTENNDEYSICLTDNNGEFFWAYGTPGGITHSFCRFGSNDPDNIISLLYDIFCVSLVDEHSDRFREIMNKDNEDEDEDEDEDDEEINIEETPLAKEYYSRIRE